MIIAQRERRDGALIHHEDGPVITYAFRRGRSWWVQLEDHSGHHSTLGELLRDLFPGEHYRIRAPHEAPKETPWLMPSR